MRRIRWLLLRSYWSIRYRLTMIDRWRRWWGRGDLCRLSSVDHSKVSHSWDLVGWWSKKKQKDYNLLECRPGGKQLSGVRNRHRKEHYRPTDRRMEGRCSTRWIRLSQFILGKEWRDRSQSANFLAGSRVKLWKMRASVISLKCLSYCLLLAIFSRFSPSIRYRNFHTF